MAKRFLLLAYIIFCGSRYYNYDYNGKSTGGTGSGGGGGGMNDGSGDSGVRNGGGGMNVVAMNCELILDVAGNPDF
ncbi:unnamed protein product [Onchocerca flexuosa]|uniref:Uncharacterized protein n=1 Tax=Onchocerca flexuosa TaxID=387005 RepID=A0A183I3L1_9BILA|nr:unnamed protein product [Onchocerca flexuosa]